MAYEKWNFMAIFVLITVGARVSLSEKCKWEEDCEKTTCGIGYPVCEDGVCSCPKVPNYDFEHRRCESENDCLKYNSTCSLVVSADHQYCRCDEYENHKNSSKLIKRKGGSGIRSGGKTDLLGCLATECVFTCVEFTDVPSIPSECGCRMLF